MTNAKQLIDGIKFIMNDLSCPETTPIRLESGCDPLDVTDELTVTVNDAGEIVIGHARRTHHDWYVVTDLKAGMSSVYTKLISFAHYATDFTELLDEPVFDSSFSGTVVIDQLFRSGKTRDRFLQVRVASGKIDPNSLAVLSLDRRDPLHVFANQTIVNNPDQFDFSVSVVTRPQRHLLEQGVSI